MKKIILGLLLLVCVSLFSFNTEDYINVGYKYMDEIFDIDLQPEIQVEYLGPNRKGYTAFIGQRATRVVLDSSYENVYEFRYYLIHELTHVYQVQKLGYKTGWSTSITNSNDYKINYFKMAMGKVNPEMEAEIVATVVNEVLKMDNFNRGKKYNKLCLKYIKREFPKLYQRIVKHSLY